jgi:Actinobacteria/chloroflexi VLRF1 release factor
VTGGVKVQPAAGGGRWVEISPQRLAGWLDGFYGRHEGVVEVGLLLAAANGDTAQLLPPPGMPAVQTIDEFLAAVKLPRRLGLLLARKGAVAAGVADGDDLVASKVERFYVQGRTAAGGWSQQRFARRRVNQAAEGVREAADIASRVLLPQVSTLDALVCGGDRATIEGILADPRLAPLKPLRHERLLDVPEPRQAVLIDAVAAAKMVRIKLLP